MRKVSILTIITVLAVLLVSCSQIDKTSGTESTAPPTSSFSAGEMEESPTPSEGSTAASESEPSQSIKLKQSTPAPSVDNTSTSTQKSQSNPSTDVSQQTQSKEETTKPSKPSQAPATSTFTQPPTTSTPTPSTPPTTSTPTPSTPPTPTYEIMGQDFINGVLKGINDRRAALGFPLAKIDSALSAECLVQAKKMAVAGYDFHSTNPTGCEGTMKVPYNFPAELMGDQMCNHVAGFTKDTIIKIGVAVVKSGNSLYVVVQGMA